MKEQIVLRMLVQVVCCWKWIERKCKFKTIFSLLFFEQEYFACLNNELPVKKVKNIHIEGTVSQIFHYDSIFILFEKKMGNFLWYFEAFFF